MFGILYQRCTIHLHYIRQPCNKFPVKITQHSKDIIGLISFSIEIINKKSHLIINLLNMITNLGESIRSFFGTHPLSLFLSRFQETL